MVIKKPSQKHFTKDFGDGTISHRVILPGPDQCPIKVTEFYPKEGFCPRKNVVHKTHELVHVLWGRIRLEVEGEVHELGAGGRYFTPAGIPTTMTALKDSCLACMFFPAEGGPLPDDE